MKIISAYLTIPYNKCIVCKDQERIPPMPNADTYRFRPFYLTNTTLERLAYLQHLGAMKKPEQRQGFVSLYHARNTAEDFRSRQWLKSKGINLVPEADLAAVEIIAPTRGERDRRFDRHRWIYVPTEICQGCAFRTDRATRQITCGRVDQKYWKVEVSTGYGESLSQALVQIWHQILPSLPSS